MSRSPAAYMQFPSNSCSQGRGLALTCATTAAYDAT